MDFFLFFFFEKKYSNKYIGVYWDKKKEKWKAQVRHNQIIYYIGYFENEEAAAKAVKSKSDELKAAEHKNSSIGVSNSKTLKKLKEKVMHSIQLLFFLQRIKL